MSKQARLLLVGEVYVDFTLPHASAESKLRLGGIVHAARGLWAIDAQYAVAAICPSYLVDQVCGYLKHHGCAEFIWLGEVTGSPNVMAIGDPTELADQAYQDLLRDEKSVRFVCDESALKGFASCLVFPGKFDLKGLRKLLAEGVSASFDIAYDIPSLGLLEPFQGSIATLITSTSSPLFLTDATENISGFLSRLGELSPKAVLIKENRGGSRAFDLEEDSFEEIPALLGETANSVGVGDVYSAVFVSKLQDGVFNAAWKAARCATCYSQTTFPDDFKRDVLRALTLTVDQMRGLGGTVLPWHERPKYEIYFAAPDFSYIDRKHIDEALGALAYHNFRVRRPVAENGELPPGSAMHTMQRIYADDVAMLEACQVVFALPQARDPGTLVEIGLALAANKPVITYDPMGENANTMVMAGSTVYSSDFDNCLNGLFEAMSKLRLMRQ